jgi:hypothetical protein
VDLERQLARVHAQLAVQRNEILRKRLDSNTRKLKAELQLRKSAIKEVDDYAGLFLLRKSYHFQLVSCRTNLSVSSLSSTTPTTPPSTRKHGVWRDGLISSNLFLPHPREFPHISKTLCPPLDFLRNEELLEPLAFRTSHEYMLCY